MCCGIYIIYIYVVLSGAGGVGVFWVCFDGVRTQLLFTDLNFLLVVLDAYFFDLTFFVLVYFVAWLVGLVFLLFTIFFLFEIVCRLSFFRSEDLNFAACDRDIDLFTVFVLLLFFRVFDLIVV